MASSFISFALILAIAIFHHELTEAAVVPNKGGMCPAASGKVGICVFKPGYNCLGDFQCPGRQKCCSEGCGRVCKDPCPYRRCWGRCAEYARDNRGCQTCRCKTPICRRIKCWRKCDVYAKDKLGCQTCNCAPKRGTCPKPQDYVCVRAVLNCKVDSDCYGRQKCCKVACGRDCRTPI